MAAIRENAGPGKRTDLSRGIELRYVAVQRVLPAALFHACALAVGTRPAEARTGQEVCVGDVAPGTGTGSPFNMMR